MASARQQRRPECAARRRPSSAWSAPPTGRGRRGPARAGARRPAAASSSSWPRPRRSVVITAVPAGAHAAIAGSSTSWNSVGAVGHDRPVGVHVVGEHRRAQHHHDVVGRRAARAAGDRCGVRKPAKAGWSSGKLHRLDSGLTHTAAPVRSASATTSAPAPSRSTPGPTTSGGPLAARRGRAATRRQRVRIADELAGDAAAPRPARSPPPSRLRGSTRAPARSVAGYGHVVGAGDGRRARPRPGPAPRSTSRTASGRLAASSAKRYGSVGSIARVCWPAVSTSGVALRMAVKTLPRAWPTPTALWRLTKAAPPRRLGVAVGHGHRRRLLQGQHVAEVGAAGRRRSAARSSPGCRRSWSSRGRAAGRGSRPGRTGRRSPRPPLLRLHPPDAGHPPTRASRSCQYGSRSSRFSTLPAPDFGSGSSRSSIRLGTL